MNKKEKFNFGAGWIIFERARGYLQSFQFLMMLAVTVKIYDIAPLYLALSSIVLGIGVVVFMRFDTKRNIPAEYSFLWRVNPEFQRLMKKVDVILAMMVEFGGRREKEKVEAVIGDTSFHEISRQLENKHDSI